MFQRTGLLSMLDVECSLRGCAETYVQKVKVQHKDNKKLFAPKHCDLAWTFGIHHYVGWYKSNLLESTRWEGTFLLLWGGEKGSSFRERNLATNEGKRIFKHAELQNYESVDR